MVEWRIGRSVGVLGHGLFITLIILISLRPALAERALPPEFRTLFQNVVLKHEYEGKGGKVLMRWEAPVGLAVHFGASVGAPARATDMTSITKVVRKIVRATGHPVTITNAPANFHLFVVGPQELRDLGPALEQTGLSAYAARAITRMPDNTNCLVVALPERDRTKGYRAAVAVVRAALTPSGRDSCFNEELAQGMGLPDDCGERPTIFNDNGEFTQLTDMDLAMLQVVYDRRLQSGMHPDQVMKTVDQITRPSS
jgi:hypothetical protein